MTHDEWNAICLHMETCWRGELDDKRRAAYFTFLGRYEAEPVMAALHRLTLNPQPFLPAVPEIVAAMRELSEDPVPGWAEVWQAILKALAVGGRSWMDASDTKQRKTVEWLEEHSHPLIARFVEAESYARLAATEFFGDYGELRVHELEQRWQEFVGVAQARQAQGLALTAAGQRRGIGPAKLDQLALLRQLRPEGEPVAELPAA